MTRTAAYNALGSEFNEFLYAPIAEEHNGMVLSVLSALARLGLDPWEQAAQWDRLPGETAASNLASLIAALPDGPSARPDPGPLATHLIALLPHRHERTSVAPAAAGASEASLPTASARSAVYMIVYLILAVFLLCSQWIFGGRPAMEQPGAPHAAATVPAVPPPPVPPASSAP